MTIPANVYDLLASESLARWGAGSPVGTPVTITYGFPTAEPSSVSYPNFTAFTGTEMTAARNALAYISTLTGITFVETSGASAQLQFGNGDLTAVGSGISGIADYSFTSSGIQQATVFLSNTGQASLADSDFVPGSITSNDIGGKGWGTLLHEIGHALGLKHPFDTNIAGDPNSILPTNLDDLSHTIMSYTPYQPSNVAIVTGDAHSYSYTYSNLDPSTYSLLDIQALQYLYGPPASSAGNKVFAFSPNAPIIETIYDAGPNDTIDCSALTGACVINMNAGTTSNLAISQALPFGLTIADQYNGTSALTIAYGCSIANCFGGSGDDRITGNGIVNTIHGNGGADIIDGRGGADTMDGGAGNDIYYVDNAGDKVIEAAGGGSDRAYASVGYALTAGAEVELLMTSNIAGTGAINLAGNEFAQQLYGNAGANLLDGKAGADLLYGLGGNDIYYVDNALDRVFEAVNGGSDRLLASVSYALAAGQEIELFTTTLTAGTGAINLTGNEFTQVIGGNNGANVIDGKAGADTMQGFGGNDIYYVDNTLDKVIEAVGGGSDRVLTSVNYTLGAGVQVETFTTTLTAGIGALNLTGNEFAQTIGGNAGANYLDGKAGSDTLQGFGGHDSFAFTSVLGPTNIDNIADFSVADDTILLAHAIFTGLGMNHVLDASAFFIGSAAGDASDRIVYNSTTGNLYFDDDGSGVHAQQQFAHLSAGLSMTNADFYVA